MKAAVRCFTNGRAHGWEHKDGRRQAASKSRTMSSRVARDGAHVSQATAVRLHRRFVSEPRILPDNNGDQRPYAAGLIGSATKSSLGVAFF